MLQTNKYDITLHVTQCVSFLSFGKGQGGKGLSR